MNDPRGQSEPHSVVGSTSPVRCDVLVRAAAEVVTMAPGSGPASSSGPVERERPPVDLGVIPRGAVAALEGRVVWVGPESEIAGALDVPDDAVVVDVEGAAVIPGLVDAHTHLTWAGDRAAEYGARLGGATYLEIQQAGGGINSTVRATREAAEEDLAALAVRRLDSFLRHGTTTLEAKSGYGLTLEDERKQLAAAKAAHPVRRVHTCLAAHLTPEEYAGREDEYIDLVCAGRLPAQTRSMYSSSRPAYPSGVRCAARPVCTRRTGCAALAAASCLRSSSRVSP